MRPVPVPVPENESVRTAVAEARPRPELSILKQAPTPATDADPPEDESPTSPLSRSETRQATLGLMADFEDHVPLDSDTYGASLFSLVEDIHILFGNTEGEDVPPRYMTVMRLVFVHIVLLFNYLLQFGMLEFINTYVVAHKEEAPSGDMSLSKFSSVVSDEVHSFLKSQEEDLMAAVTGQKEEVMCVVAHPLFVVCVLCLWTLTALIELRKLEKFITTLSSLVTVDSIDHTIFPDFDADGFEIWEIKGLTSGLRLVVYSAIVLPKIIIVILLFALGFIWLSSTKSPVDLLLNALSLAFVVDIDEALYKCLLPDCLKSKMQRVSLTVLRIKSKDEHQQMLQLEKTSFIRSFLYFVVPIVFSCSYVMYIHEKQGHVSADD
eukprot:TRINITY_DN75044_c0_g1_i1.p1 TRINITY_DN75044_c0_g1~~TRINITY_DN75044_c0_g1_i1.p1  ORF type:complete len:379 (-),score=87.32 TRINITY_DN75044_c0_g1_i1:67-1203(-)